MPFEVPNVIGSLNNAAPLSDLQAQPEYMHWNILSRHVSGQLCSGCAVTEQTVPDNTVQVAAGRVRVAGSQEVAVSAGNVTITGMSSDPRFDLVVASSGGVKSVVIGTPGAVPCFPTSSSVVLAAVYVPAGVGAPTITNDNIMDLRAVSTGGEDNPFGYLWTRSMSTPSFSPGGNRNLLYNRVFGTNSRMFIYTDDLRELGPLGDKASELLFQPGQSGGWSAPHSSTWSDGFFGAMGGVPTNVGTPTLGSDQYGRYFDFESGATSGDNAGWENVNGIWRRNGEMRFAAKIALPTVTSIRAFVGWGPDLATMVGADTPSAQNYAGFQFSTDRGDSGWRYIRNDGSSSGVTSTDPGIGISAGVPQYLVYYTRTALNSVARILSDTYTLLDENSALGPLDQPSPTVDLRFIVGCETRTGAARKIRSFWGNNYSAKL